MRCTSCGGPAEELARTRRYVWVGCRRCLRSWRLDTPSAIGPSPADIPRAGSRSSRIGRIARGALISIGAVAFAFACRMALQRWMGTSSPFLLFTPAVMVAAVWAGVGGGVIATSLSAILGSRFFLAALAGEPTIERWDRVVLFTLVGALITALTAVIERTRRQLTESVWREQTVRAAAEAANEAKDEFLALVSHELQTPASVVLGWLSTIRSQRLTGRALTRALEVVERNAILQSRLVADVLDTSRIANGAMRIEQVRIDLAALVRDAADQMRPSLHARQLEFDAQLVDERWPMSGDPVRLQQVFTNLLSNAAKFTPPGGRVSLTMKRSDTDAIIQVADTGIGIAPEFVPRVFERFEQEPEAATLSRKGLGLGLSICRHLVEQHRGEISVRSGGRDQGATFSVRLPLLPVEDETQMPPHTAISADALRSISVLLVEDDDDTRALLADILASYGATVSACRSATEGAWSIETRRCDVLVCDLQLPHADGLTFIRRLRQHADAELASTPAASITASTHPEDRDAALAAGYQLHLQKPVAPDDLAKAMITLARPRPDTTAH